MTSTPRTLYEKIWQAHVVETQDDGTCLVYIDRHLVHEVTSPQAFEGLRAAGRKVRRPDLTLAVPDHNLPTTARLDANGKELPILDPQSAQQLAALRVNAPEFGIRYIDATDRQQGIVHVVGPEQGFSLPGATIVCGDSHTACHGGIGALAFGIGTTEVEHVLATQTLLLKPARTLEIRVEGKLGAFVTPKDVILHVIGVIGTAGGTGHVIEYRGNVFEQMSIEGRLTVCNMSIEAGARAGLIAPDEKTFAYLKGRPYSPKGAEWDAAVARWKSVASDPGCHYDDVVTIPAADIAPTVTWGINPGQGISITESIPDPALAKAVDEKASIEEALAYMKLRPGAPIKGTKIDVAFLGSCTNGRLSDFQEVAKYMKGRKVAPSVKAIAVPGSQIVALQCEKLGLDKILSEAGFEWRAAGCSMCLAMNPDKLIGDQLCASSSNRNFKGRQGSPTGRTILMSPLMVAAAAVTGAIADAREVFHVSSN